MHLAMTQRGINFDLWVHQDSLYDSPAAAIDLLLDVLIISVKYFSASQGLMEVTPVVDIPMSFNFVCAGVDVQHLLPFASGWDRLSSGIDMGFTLRHPK